MITLIQSLLLDQTKPGAHSRDALQAEEKEAVVTMDVNEAQAVVAFFAEGSLTRGRLARFTKSIHVPASHRTPEQCNWNTEVDGDAAPQKATVVVGIA